MTEEQFNARAAALGLPHVDRADADGPAIIAAATALAAANAQNVGVIAATAAALELAAAVSDVNAYGTKIHDDERRRREDRSRHPAQNPQAIFRRGENPHRP
ncbi:hypothetical protein [Varunaivibrio sulfuroxidans]|uniref:hypothetical protein n=1 Tax=Varunaivibrio sulfuroxidans TaxID=1773489 RepID=UPI0010531B97|nr:hypothetical protein [Varunaivibrio sulfuroxidans]WES30193.1 hypothetical protein P3M64_11180 [Varunaivibrio sulfuroxidans]